MLTLLQYMLQLSACYAAMYFFYWLMLRPLTSYKSNRIYFLLMSLLAFAIPFLRLDIFISPQTINASGFINYIPSLNIGKVANEYAPEANSVNISVVLITVFISGVVIFLAHFIIQLISFRKITGNASLINKNSSIKLYQLDIDIMPFSFGNAVYVNKYKHTATELDDIIKHEAVHAQQQHTIDAVLAELICILNWYNPFVWMIKKAIKQNLEFLADNTVIDEGINKKRYQYLLLKVTGYSPLNIASSFKISSLKQRIYMMNKKRTSQKHLFKLFFVLPLIAVVMLAFRNNHTSILNAVNNNIKEDTFMLSELTYEISDVNVDKIVKKAQDKSLLHVGKPVSITLIINEKDRLKLLLKKNGYNNISDHAIKFLIDTTQTNNLFAVQINIDLQKKDISFHKKNIAANNIVADNHSTHLQTTNSIISETASKLIAIQQQMHL